MAESWVVYSASVEAAYKGELDMEGDTLELVALGSSYTPNANSHVDESDLADEESNYTRPTLTNVSVDRSGAATTINADDAEITAVGGALAIRTLAILDTTADRLIAYLVPLPGNDINVPEGVKLVVELSVNGIQVATANPSP